jgi:hypothetical protein
MADAPKRLDLTLHVIGTDDTGYMARYTNSDVYDHTGASLDDIKSSVIDTLSKALDVDKKTLAIVEDFSVDPNVTLNKQGIALNGVIVTYKISF